MGTVEGQSRLELLEVSSQLCDVVLAEALDQAIGLQSLDQALLALLAAGCRKLVQLKPLFAGTRTAGAILAAGASLAGEPRQEAAAERGQPAGRRRDVCPLCEGAGKLDLPDLLHSSSESGLARLIASAAAHFGAAKPSHEGGRAGAGALLNERQLNRALAELRNEQRRLQAQVARLERQPFVGRNKFAAGLEPLPDEPDLSPSAAPDRPPLAGSARWPRRSPCAACPKALAERGSSESSLQLGSRTLSTDIQRMKRMDTLKRRKIKRQQQQQQQVEAPAAADQAPSRRTCAGSESGPADQRPRQRPADQTDEEANEKAVHDEGPAPADAKLINVRQFIQTNCTSSGDELSQPAGPSAGSRPQQQASDTVQQLQQQQQKRRPPADRKKRFSLSAFGSSVSAAISSPFGSPARKLAAPAGRPPGRPAARPGGKCSCFKSSASSQSLGRADWR